MIFEATTWGKLKYGVHLINKVKYSLRSWHKEAVFTVASFSRRSTVIDPFMSQKMSTWLSLQTAAPRTFSLPEIQCISNSWLVFSSRDRSGKPMFSQFVIISTSFSVCIIDSSVHFTCFALIRHWNFDDRALLKPGAFFLICRYFEWP